MKISPEEIVELTAEVHDWAVDLRRYFHKYPELSYHENNTSKHIWSILEENNIEICGNYASNGILAKIQGELPGKKVVALRADIDALPITELTKTKFCSKNNGVMHACGHDIHMASLLGCAKILKQLTPRFGGTVLLIFQPAEEKVPGGAKQMMDEGMFSNFKPDIVIGQHVDPNIECGKIGLKPGKYMASTDEIHITVIGKGGHAALPHTTIDPVLTSAHILTSLQHVVSRKCSPLIPSVLSFGKIEGKGADNVIPDKVTIEGTFRTMDETWRKQALKIIDHTVVSVASSMGAHAHIDIRNGYPYLENDDSLSLFVREKAIELLGEQQVIKIEPEMTAEDFAYFGKKYPSVFYRLGIRNEQKGIVHQLHSPFFDADENSLKTGISLMSFVTLSYF